MGAALRLEDCLLRLLKPAEGECVCERECVCVRERESERERARVSL